MLNSAWRHRREDHRCEEISPCPYRGQILLERRRFSNVNQIDEDFDPDRPRRQDDEDEDEGDDPEGEHGTATTSSPATAGTEHSVRELNCCCVIS